MSNLLKLSALLLVPAVPGLYFFIKGLNIEEPIFGHIKTPTSGKFGEDFQLYLADAEDSNKDIDPWWVWSFYNKYYPKKDETDLSNEFKGLESPEKLKAKCKETYSKVTDTDLKGSNNSDNKTKYGRDAWRFCSVFDEKPNTIEDNSGEGKSDKNNLDTGGDYKGKLGETKKSELVSVTDTTEVNKRFWLLREKEFFGSKGVDGIGKTSNSTKNLFDNLYADKENITIAGDKLKEKCGEIYKTTKDNSSNKYNEVSEADAIKYCGLKAKKPVSS